MPAWPFVGLLLFYIAGGVVLAFYASDRDPKRWFWAMRSFGLSEGSRGRPMQLWLAIGLLLIAGTFIGASFLVRPLQHSFEKRSPRN